MTLELKRTGKRVAFKEVCIGSVFFAHGRFWIRTDREAATELSSSVVRGSACNFVIDPNDEYVEYVVCVIDGVEQHPRKPNRLNITTPDDLEDLRPQDFPPNVELTTSGTVQATVGTSTRPWAYRFGDLSVCAQEFIRAIKDAHPLVYRNNGGAQEFRDWGYSDLASSSLTLIIEDCTHLRQDDPRGLQTESGKHFFDRRQRGDYENYSKMEIFLNDEDQVCIL